MHASNPKKGLVSEYPINVVRVRGAFRVDTAGPGDPDGARPALDTLFSVARTAAGRFTVTLDPSLTHVPQQLTYASVQVHNVDEAPGATVVPVSGYVKNLAISAGVFEIDTITENAANAPAVGDPEDNSWVTFEIEGPFLVDDVSST